MHCTVLKRDAIAVAIGATLTALAALPFTAGVEPPHLLLPSESEWRYWDRGPLPDASLSWTQPGYDDGEWRVGHGIFGYGDAAARFGTTLSGTPRTVYFRRRLYVPHSVYERVNASDAHVWARLLVDDGAAVYVNGVHGLRFNVPSTKQAPVLSIKYKPKLQFGQPYDNDYGVVLRLATDGLVAGWNCVAVEVRLDAVPELVPVPVTFTAPT